MIGHSWKFYFKKTHLKSLLRRIDDRNYYYEIVLKKIFLIIVHHLVGLIIKPETMEVGFKTEHTSENSSLNSNILEMR